MEWFNTFIVIIMIQCLPIYGYPQQIKRNPIDFDGNPYENEKNELGKLIYSLY